MICRLSSSEFDSMLGVVNDGAQVYRGVIPEDRWKEPYMSAQELQGGIDDGVEFYGWMEKAVLVAVMGIQHVEDVTLIRHSYVLTHYQRRGIGGRLLRYLIGSARTSDILVGTWEAASWAVRFYETHGFKLVSRKEKDRLLRKYWDIPERQIETSAVLKLKKQQSIDQPETSLNSTRAET